MKTRFDLEEEIMDSWRVTTDINTLFEAVVEQDLTRDQIANTLLGLHQLYELKFDRMFRTFEELVANKEIK